MEGNIYKIYKGIEVDRCGCRDLRDVSCDGFYFVCAVGGQVFHWALEER